MLGETTNTLHWPPLYTIRQSSKAKHTFLQMTPAMGLEIVVPIKRKRINIEQILTEKRLWIEKMLFKFGKNALVEKPLIEKPNFIECLCISDTWKIDYQFIPQSNRVTLKETTNPEKILRLKGNTENTALCIRILKKWLIKIAGLQLIPQLYALSTKTDLAFYRTCIRGQSTLWGSCNARKNISLNYKLLFLPKTLVEHVLLHELCHLKYLNHSPQFWGLLASWDKNMMENKRALKMAERYVPAWLS